MNKKGSVPVYIAVAIALVFMGILFSLVTASTNSTRTTQTLTNVIVNVNETLSYDGLESVTSVSNGSVTLTATRDYTSFLIDGKIKLLNATYNDTSLIVGYNYYDVGYISGSLARMIAVLIPVIFGVAILVLSIKK